jgi:hypothetical protein
MMRFANMSFQRTAAVSLLTWFVPFLPLFLIFGNDLSARHLPAFGSSLVFLPGAAIWALMAWVAGSHGQIPEWLVWCSGILMPAGFVAATVLAARWRIAVLVAGILAASGLSWVAYIMMRA